MADAAGCILRAMDVLDLPNVLAWRNHPDVRRCMLSQHEISLEDHHAWFERTAKDATRRLLIVEEAGQPLGFVQFSGVLAGGVSDWGFYAVPGATKGSGWKLGRAALDYAFVDLGLHKVCGQALEFNEASIGFHLALGFKQEGVLREQHYMDGRYHHLVCFGLLADEWTPTSTT